VADEVAVQEGGLVDDVRAGAQGFEGCSGRAGRVAQVLGDLDDRAAGALNLALQVGQVRRFELVATLEEQLGVLVGLGSLRLQRLVVERAQVER